MRPYPVSHSSLSRFINCPKQFYELRVVKRVKDEQNEASIWGDRVHKSFEQTLKGEAELPPEMACYQGYLDEIKKVTGKMSVEVKLAIDNNLQPCDFYAANAFLRCIVDVLHVQEERALTMDHKTGKPRPSRQLKLTALILFHHLPQIQICKTGYFWLKTNTRNTEIYTREQIPELWQEFLPDLRQFKQAFETDTWQPRQSGLCNGWCPVHDCEYWKPKGSSTLRRRG